MMSHEPILAGTYDYFFVSLSVLIAILSAYAALDFSGRITSATGRPRLLWLNGGAIAMGTGVWSMHYVGMLAFRLPIPVQYDWPTVLLSLLAAILASGIALFIVSRERMGLVRAMFGSVLMGAGIAAMHYIGMSAMRMPAKCSYSTSIVVLSVALAIVISLVALWVTFHLREETSAWSLRKILSAVMMGAAIPIMHYTGMAAASFMPATGAHQDFSHAVSVSSLSAAGIIIVSVLGLGVVPLASLRFDALSDTRQLTARYFLFLGAIGLLSILGTLLVQHQGQQSRSDARMINIAGRQRMLSQAIAKDALLIARSQDAAERQHLVEELRGLDALWENSHSALQNGEAVLGLQNANSPKVHQMFAGLETDYRRIVDATRALAAKVSEEKQPADVSEEVRLILVHERPYLQAMDGIVFQCEREAETRDNTKNQLQMGLVLSVLGILLLQGLVVLRPALNKIQESIGQLLRTKQELQRKAKFVELLQSVAVAANEATSLEAALQFTLDRVCQQTNWPVGHVYFRRATTSNELVSSKLWHLDNATQFATFCEVTERTPLEVGVGLPGRVAESGKPAWIPDINVDTNFPRRSAALDLGVNGAFAFPVVAHGEVAAVLEFFSSHIEVPDEELLSVMSHVGTQLGQIVERTQAQDELLEVQKRLKNSIEELEVRNREARTLGEMADLLQSCFTLEEASAVIASSVTKLFQGFSGAVFVFSASRNVLEITTTWGRSGPAERVFSPNDCWALRRGCLHHSESAAGAVRCKHWGEGSSLPGLCTPLMAQGETLGVLCLVAEPDGSSETLGPISGFNAKLASSVAEQAALSFANLKLREKLRYQSIRDPLTGLFNRRYLDESLERELPRAMRKNRNLGIVMLDVDHFKRFNDMFGHDAGDTVLKELGDCLTKFIRRGDIACRYGGEEFTLILPECSLEDTHHRAEELRTLFRQLSIKHKDIALGKVTLSLGVAALPEHGTAVAELLAAADRALLRAKEEGRDRVVTAEVSPNRLA